MRKLANYFMLIKLAKKIHIVIVRNSAEMYGPLLEQAVNASGKSVRLVAYILLILETLAGPFLQFWIKFFKLKISTNINFKNCPQSECNSQYFFKK